MGKFNTIREKIKNESRSLTFEEVVYYLAHCGYTLYTKGKTSGSRVIFVRNNQDTIEMHRPHPQKELTIGAIKALKEKLDKEGLL